jgi:hypothetical protein
MGQVQFSNSGFIRIYSHQCFQEINSVSDQQSKTGADEESREQGWGHHRQPSLRLSLVLLCYGALSSFFYDISHSSSYCFLISGMLLFDTVRQKCQFWATLKSQSKTYR